MRILVTPPKVILLCVLLISFFTFLPVYHVSAEQDIKMTIDNYVETFLEKHRIPGASIAIVHENKIFYSNGWGVTGEGEKVTTKTPFLLGSISKSLTGLAIMKLIEEDTVNLEDPVQKYIPWFTLKDQQAAAQITIKHLLSHTSGISTYSGLLKADQGSKNLNAIKNNVKSLSNVDLTALPGAKYQYSDANYIILGALIEEVTNQTFSDYMKQQIFLPLGMTNTGADKKTAYKKGYHAGYQSWLGIPRKSKVPYDNGGAPYGYIAASAKDMVQYIKLLNQRGNNNLLTKKNMDLYLSPLIQIPENEYYGFGLKITSPDSENEMIWHSGSTPDSHAELFFIPESGWGGVILTNKNHIQEEVALPYLKQGIINILNGDELVDIPKYIPIVQLVIIAIICLLFVMFIYLLVKVKSGKIRKGKPWCFAGIILFVLSIIIVPLLIYSVKSPWHVINGFAADIALLIRMMVILLALNGLLSIYVSFKKLKEGS
ncbi:serine hydrolase domain-containing protein [Metabacillus arenae]|uniref:Beta-lactamase family protein n=1 Tax=Metabacillus arenae TaxID=2771434 RepID=A0A926NPM7_9BACI|nr:serine hydrolase domain-containing protein [Metabacillus arenae]MBD1381762.1 beta-lactamase family protein [Metabacillus arenae]